MYHKDVETLTIIMSIKWNRCRNLAQIYNQHQGNNMLMHGLSQNGIKIMLRCHKWQNTFTIEQIYIILYLFKTCIKAVTKKSFSLLSVKKCEKCSQNLKWHLQMTSYVQFKYPKLFIYHEGQQILTCNKLELENGCLKNYWIDYWL